MDLVVLLFNETDALTENDGPLPEKPTLPPNVVVMPVVYEVDPIVVEGDVSISSIFDTSPLGTTSMLCESNRQSAVDVKLAAPSICTR